MPTSMSDAPNLDAGQQVDQFVGFHIRLNRTGLSLPIAALRLYAPRVNPGRAVSIQDAISRLRGPWQPHDLVAANESIVRVVRLDGEFPWHEHDEDEVFLCWDGKFGIEMEGHERVELGAGEVFVVPRRTRHRPVAASVAHALLLERPETQQYGSG